MCGIVGAVSNRNIVPILIEGLKRLEYRGYDSCGVAVHQGGELRRARSTSRVAELDAEVARDDVSGGTGIAHTRWATHGAPVVHNAHPHFSRGPGVSDAQVAVSGGSTSQVGRIALVHNGIIENHDELRAELVARGYVFNSQTDTEVIAHLVDHLYDGDLLDAVQRATTRLRGAYAIASSDWSSDVCSSDLCRRAPPPRRARPRAPCCARASARRPGARPRRKSHSPGIRAVSGPRSGSERCCGC